MLEGLEPLVKSTLCIVARKAADLSEEEIASLTAEESAEEAPAE